jgi:hypothetical protein
VAIYTGAKALSRWPINDESTLTVARWVLNWLPAFTNLSEICARRRETNPIRSFQSRGYDGMGSTCDQTSGN